jgi:hypothetical protein
MEQRRQSMPARPLCAFAKSRAAKAVRHPLHSVRDGTFVTGLLIVTSVSMLVSSGQVKAPQQRTNGTWPRMAREVLSFLSSARILRPCSHLRTQLGEAGLRCVRWRR